MILSASPEHLTDAGVDWLNRDRKATAASYAIRMLEAEPAIRTRAADAAFNYLLTRPRRKCRDLAAEARPPCRGIGWYLAWPFAALCGWIPLVPEAPHENDHEA